MQNQTILVLQGPDGTDHDLSYLADTARSQNAHLSVLHIGPVQSIPAYAYGGMPYGAVAIPQNWIQDRHDLTEAMEAKRKQSNAFFDKEGLSGEAGVICSFPASLDDDVAPRAMLCDIAVLQHDLRAQEEAYDKLLYGLLFKSPVSVIINPHQSRAPLSPERVFIAWNASDPAARAVHEALPMLKSAQQVTIGIFDAKPKRNGESEDPGADLAKWLSHHGCHVTVDQYESEGASLAAAICAKAKSAGTDLIVMGAYGHTRLREAVFGGTTREMIAQQDSAVLMAH
ncbi:universal stress protein [Loktanella agnita]|uniref:universal stress protein n=1 Tax=Loktanella agnita TaxID=287097 RepID=UPI0039877075